MVRHRSTATGTDKRFAAFVPPQAVQGPALRHPGRFGAVSAFAPIVSPMNAPWGEKALTGHLGPNRAGWRGHRTCWWTRAARTDSWTVS
jgi:S-formylglutathione hydrolase FrmB